jgi:hypothetical protein
MKLHRFVLMLVAGLGLTSGAAAQKLDIEQVEESIRYINDLQNPDGAFRPAATDRQSDLGATSSALRAIKYLHPRARPRDTQGPVQYVEKCYDASTGSFRNRPDGTTDVRTTAMGLMAMAELKMPTDKHAAAITKYFAANAKTLPDIYIAAAALAAAEIQTPKAADWIAEFDKTRQADGTYGKDAFESAGAAITILRLKGEIKEPLAVADQLLAAQRPDGGFGRPDQPSDLSTTYRIMRAVHMLKRKPDVERCRAFIARCRNEDGGYGVSPGQPSTTSATYFAAIVTHWLDEAEKVLPRCDDSR